MDGLIETAVVYFHRKAWPRALREDLLLHLVEEVDPEAGAAGQLPVAVLFVDVAGYTTFTEEVGDLAAAAMLDRFSAMVRELVDDADGRIIKQIGDEFMIVFPHGSAAVKCGLAIADRASAEPDFPELRLGAHTGTALYREADYVGATVNTAARIAGQATGGQFLVSEAMRSEIGGLGLETRSLGERRLKGFSKPFELFEVSAP
jgi:adenylate cyclase